VALDSFKENDIMMLLKYAKMMSSPTVHAPNEIILKEVADKIVEGKPAFSMGTFQ
jgi:hypothetical protein